MGEEALCRRRRGAEIWSARMKRMLGFLNWGSREGGGVEMEEAAEGVGLGA